MVIFYSYVSLPEGNHHHSQLQSRRCVGQSLSVFPREYPVQDKPIRDF
jgi:hypothetical protein